MPGGSARSSSAGREWGIDMVSRYVVYDAQQAESYQSEAEFEKLETAMDFVEFYRRRYPERRFQIRGISYNRSGVTVGGEIASWEPIPQELRREAALELLAWLETEERPDQM